MPSKPKGCAHLALKEFRAGDRTYALCETCRRVWVLVKEGEPE